MKKITTIILIFVLAFTVPLVASAETDSPTYTFTRSVNEKTVATKAIYNVQSLLDLKQIGTFNETGKIADIESDKNGNLYILTSSGRIFMFNSDFEFVKECFVYENNQSVDFSDAEGILVISENEYYIADTVHNRILHISDNTVVQTIADPSSDLIPDDLSFQPSKLAIDANGYIYAVSKGCYYGAFLFTPEGEFASFYGANTVSGSVLTTISNIWNRLTQNDVKRSKTKKVLPYDFSDIFTDEKGFVYTVSGTNSNGDLGQVRMLSPGGSNILLNCDSTNFGESDSVTRLNEKVRQNFCSVTVDENGFIYALDNTYGFIYVYDNRSNLIAAFGGGRGHGTQAGTFVNACSLAFGNNKVYVADSYNQNITVFSRTQFGESYLTAQKFTNESDYTSALPYWEEVINEDSMNYLALKGLANAAYFNADYSSAMDYAKKANDKSLYSAALSQVQTEFYSKHFVWIFPLAIAALIALVLLILISIKKKLTIIKNVQLNTCVSTMYHPFRAFYDIKYRGQGSVVIALVLTALFFLSGAFCTICSDFRYTNFDASVYNIAFQLVQTIGIILLWTVGNWAISSLMGGKGRIKEVFIVTAYATLPLILFNVISTPLSHIIASESSFAISGLKILAYIICGIVLCVGLMTIHEESFTRVLALAFLTVVMMILIVFVVFMIGILLTQCYGFIRDVVSEVIQWNKLK